MIRADIPGAAGEPAARSQKGVSVPEKQAGGYAAECIILPFSGPSVLGCGAWFKNTVCVTRGNEAFVSQPIGDLDNAAACEMLDETVDQLCQTLDVAPMAVAHDLHPDFYSTRFAERYAKAHRLPVYAVQHHHAHLLALCAEHGVVEPVLGLALDGVGYGTDGAAWGGELLKVEGAAFRRIGHLAPLRLAGGDRAAREPWRVAAAVLSHLGRADEIVTRFPAQAGAKTVCDMLQRRVNCPETSSMGRWFDAAAGLLEVCPVQHYEAEAAIALEALAKQYGDAAPLEGGYTIDDAGVLDFYPLMAKLADCKDKGCGAASFHATVAAGLVEWALRAASEYGIGKIALGGGCFLNNLLSRALNAGLSAKGLCVLNAKKLSPGDGAISLGQAFAALQNLRQGR